MKRLPVVYSRDLSGKSYWRSLSERAGSSEFQESLAAEFPENASEAPAHLTRRGFLGILGATAALAVVPAEIAAPVGESGAAPVP